jgi:hypothetical protein
MKTKNIEVIKIENNPSGYCPFLTTVINNEG